MPKKKVKQIGWALLDYTPQEKFILKPQMTIYRTEAEVREVYNQLALTENYKLIKVKIEQL